MHLDFDTLYFRFFYSHLGVFAVQKPSFFFGGGGQKNWQRFLCINNSELQIRGGIEDNSNIFFLFSQ